MFSRYIHIIACINTSFPFIAKKYSIPRIHHLLFIYSSAYGLLSCFYLLTITNHAYKHSHTSVFVDMCFYFFGYITRSNIAESYGKYVKLQRNFQAVLPRIWTTLHSHQQCMRVSISPHPQQHSFSSDRFHNSYPQGYKLLFHGGFDDS